MIGIHSSYSPHDLLLGVCLHDEGDEAADVPAAVLQGPGAQLVRPVHGAEVALPAHRRHGGLGRGGVTRVAQQQGSRVQPGVMGLLIPFRYFDLNLICRSYVLIIDSIFGENVRPNIFVCTM